MALTIGMLSISRGDGQSHDFKALLLAADVDSGKRWNHAELDGCVAF
ncbi:hypothetical protein [Actinomyces gaoshouyii]|nr:hypothetical protein [Actinomyces gaoshouyii]